MEKLLEENYLIEGFNEEKLEELKKQAQGHTGWEKIYGAVQNDKILQAHMTGIERVSDMICAVVMVDNVKGLIPIKLFGADNRRHLRTFIGKEVAFTIENYDREAEVFTGSRIRAMEQLAEMTLERLEEGDVTPFVITGVRPNGLFGDIGGIQAFIPIHEIRYGWVDNLYDEYKEGEHLLVEVQRISLKEGKEDEPINYHALASAKALQENPWEEGGVAHTFKKRNEYMGVVSGVAEYGVFVRLADGVDSLARHLKFENANVGDKVVVRINDIDVEQEQIRSQILRII